MDDRTPDTPADTSGHAHTARSPEWDLQHQLLLDLACQDLAAGSPVLPTMIAFDGDEPLAVITLRSFPRGGHAEPLVEAGAVLTSLGADRVLLSLGGRAWSVHDPIPPVLGEDADLRQQVIVIHESRHVRGAVTGICTVHPVAAVPTWDPAWQADDPVELGDPIQTDDPQGWVTELLAVLVRAGAEEAQRDADGAPRTAWDPATGGSPVGGVTSADIECAVQVQRCEGLGHRFAWGPRTSQRLLAAFALLEQPDPVR